MMRQYMLWIHEIELCSPLSRPDVRQQMRECSLKPWETSEKLLVSISGSRSWWMFVITLMMASRFKVFIIIIIVIIIIIIIIIVTTVHKICFFKVSEPCANVTFPLYLKDDSFVFHMTCCSAFFLSPAPPRHAALPAEYAPFANIK